MTNKGIESKLQELETEIKIIKRKIAIIDQFNYDWITRDKNTARDIKTGRIQSAGTVKVSPPKNDYVPSGIYTGQIYNVVPVDKSNEGGNSLIWLNLKIIDGSGELPNIGYCITLTENCIMPTQHNFFDVIGVPLPKTTKKGQLKFIETFDYGQYVNNGYFKFEVGDSDSRDYHGILKFISYDSVPW